MRVLFRSPRYFDWFFPWVIQKDEAWEKIGTDIFEYKAKRYLMIVDYFSRFIIVIRSETVSNTLMEVLTEYGLPSTIMADCGTQYTSDFFQKNAKIPASK